MSTHEPMTPATLDHAHPGLRTYLAVFLALLVLTGVTVAAAFLDLGPVNTPVAMGVASLKAILVLYWFMHLKVSHRLVWVFVGAGLVMLLILIGFAVIEGFTR
jgi:cytochrome c oxidase subunit 4